MAVSFSWAIRWFCRAWLTLQCSGKYYTQRKCSTIYRVNKRWIIMLYIGLCPSSLFAHTFFLLIYQRSLPTYVSWFFVFVFFACNSVSTIGSPWCQDLLIFSGCCSHLGRGSFSWAKFILKTSCTSLAHSFDTCLLNAYCMPGILFTEHLMREKVA